MYQALKLEVKNNRITLARMAKRWPCPLNSGLIYNYFSTIVSGLCLLAIIKGWPLGGWTVISAGVSKFMLQAINEVVWEIEYWVLWTIYKYCYINELSKADFSLLYFCVFGCEFINLVHFLALLLGFEVKFLLSKGGLVNLTETLT